MVHGDCRQHTNPAAADAIREEYLEKFRAVAQEHPGTVAGALALFEVAGLRAALGQREETLDTWQEALATAEGNPGLQGMLHQRIAATYEEAGDWAQAAAAHESAGSLADYPLRYWALVEAARCWRAAGDPVQALALYERVETEAPDLRLPEHLRSEIRDLRITRSGA